MSKNGREYFRLGAESYSSLGRVGKKRRKYLRQLWCEFAYEQVSSPRSYRLKISIYSFENLELYKAILYQISAFSR